MRECSRGRFVAPLPRHWLKRALCVAHHAVEQETVIVYDEVWQYWVMGAGWP